MKKIVVEDVHDNNHSDMGLCGWRYFRFAYMFFFLLCLDLSLKESGESEEAIAIFMTTILWFLMMITATWKLCGIAMTKPYNHTCTRCTCVYSIWMLTEAIQPRLTWLLFYFFIFIFRVDRHLVATSKKQCHISFFCLFDYCILCSPVPDWSPDEPLGRLERPSFGLEKLFLRFL